MKKWYMILLLIGAAYYVYEQGQRMPSPEQLPSKTLGSAAETYDQRHSGRRVEDRGTVSRVLSDDNEGSRHQRFVLQLGSGQTLLVAHNIDVAPRVPSLKVGDTVAFYGEYEWNEQGGVIHWTHHDPQGRHPGGWLEHEGRRYE